MISSMKWSRKGAKDNTRRLAWSKYFKYVVENEEYFFKQKAYVTYCDGWIDSETIKEQTYKNAIKRGNECIEVLVEEDIVAASTEYLILIFCERYEMSKKQIEKSIFKAKEAIKQIKKHSTVSAATEYRIFKRVMEYHINLTQKVVKCTTYQK